MMTSEEAIKFRAEWNAEVQTLSRMATPTLRDIDGAELAKAGMHRIVGNLSRDELISDILDMRGYSTERVNESTHVVAHVGQVIWDACEWCQPAPDPDHIPSDDPPGADSSPMSELQRNALATPAKPAETTTPADYEAACARYNAISGAYGRLDDLIKSFDRVLGEEYEAAHAALREHEREPGVHKRFAGGAMLTFDELDKLEALAVKRLERIFPWSVSVALAEHTLGAIDKILGA